MQAQDSWASGQQNRTDFTAKWKPKKENKWSKIIYSTSKTGKEK
jgi:hypothetical protein